jgi:hypothetical protein
LFSGLLAYQMNVKGFPRARERRDKVLKSVDSFRALKASEELLELLAPYLGGKGAFDKAREKRVGVLGPRWQRTCETQRGERKNVNKRLRRPRLAASLLRNAGTVSHLCWILVAPEGDRNRA